MLLTPVARGAGTVLGAMVDTWAQGMGRHDNALILMLQGAVGTSVQIAIEHSHTGNVGTFVDHSIRTAVTVADTFYEAHIRRFRRYLRIRCISVGQGNVTGVTFVANRTFREPVQLAGTAI